MSDNKITDVTDATTNEASQPNKASAIKKLTDYIKMCEESGDAAADIRAKVDKAVKEIPAMALTQAELEAEIYPLITERPILFKGLDETVNGLLEQVDNLKAQGLDDDAIKQNIRQMNATRCDPPLSEADLNTMIFEPADLNDDFVTLDKVKPETVEWLWPQRAPKGEITIVGGEGGSGKTSFWVALVARVVTGRENVFEQDDTHDDIPFNEPAEVMVLTSEDSISKKLLSTFDAYNLTDRQKSRIHAIDASSWNIGKYTTDSEIFRKKVEQIKPALVILDPLQGFLADGVDMSRRNQMRHALEPLKAMGAAYGTTFVIIAHTNKRLHAYGVERISDSKDISDIARSVMLVGYTGKKDADGYAIRYLSLEKSNYAAREEVKTILFTLPGGKVKFYGVTDKKEDEIRREREHSDNEVKAKPDQDEIKAALVDYLKESGGEAVTGELFDFLVKDLGYVKKHVRNANSDLLKEGIIKGRKDGKSKKHFTVLTDIEF